MATLLKPIPVSIKPYTKDRTKMTITKEDLRQFSQRDKLARIATHIEFLNTCLNVLPNYPANQDEIERYLSAMEKACAEMQEELVNGA